MRRCLPGILLLLLLWLASCQNPLARPAAGTATASGASGQVEVYSWWTGGSEADALANLLKIFNLRNPDVQFTNVAASGEGAMLGPAELAAQLDEGIVPDSWQENAGQELLRTHVAQGRLEPLNFLYEDEGWLPVMPEQLLPFISQNNLIYSVPISIHRANMLWYNTEVLSEHGLEPPGSFDEWLASMERLQAGGMAFPLALGDSMTALHLLETTLLAGLPSEEYTGLWSGETAWQSGKVRGALEWYARLLTFANPEHAGLTWEETAQRLGSGEAAFYVMGDWVEGYFRAELRMQPGEGFGWLPVPGTEDSFQFLSEGFVLPVGAANRRAAIAWLRTIGSREGQNAFNQVNGSIPARTDILRSVYDEYQQTAIDAWTRDTVVGSLTHGVVASEPWREAIEEALLRFLEHRNVLEFQEDLVAACQNAGPCS